MRKLKRIKEKTAHQRACFFALIFILLLSGATALVDVFRPELPQHMRVVLCSSLPLAIVLLLYDRTRNVHRGAFYRLQPIAPGSVGIWILFGIGANGFATVFNAPIQNYLSGYEAFEMVSTQAPTSVTEFIIGIIVLCLLPAILEELFCRGIILREYERYGALFAVLAAASMFALLHMTVASFVYTWVLGIVLAIVVLKTNSVYPAMLMHFSANFFSLTRSYLSYLMPTELQTLWLAVQIFLIGLLAFGFFFAMMMLVKIHGKENKVRRDKNQRFGISICFLILILLYVFNHIRLLAEILSA